MREKQRDEALKEGTILKRRYKIEHVLGVGGYGITYAGEDIQDKRKVAIKECYQINVCKRGTNARVVLLESSSMRQTFEDTKTRFKEEANLLKENNYNPGIIQVYEVFEENNTVYYVMELLDGCDLKQYLKEHDERLSWEETSQLLEPIFTALISLHRFNIWHRDISPDNIFICKDGQVRLIDFGSARTGELGKSRLLDAAKAGYAPLEQYNDKWEQGTWTDVYAMAATVYRCITGVVPPSAPARVKSDEYQRPSVYAQDIPDFVDEAITKGLELLVNDRFKTMAEIKCALFEDNKTMPLADRMIIEEKSMTVRTFEPRLMCLDGVFKGKEFALEDELFIGRKEDVCKIVFPPYTPGVSGMHCSIKWDANKKRCTLHDLNSTYGTRNLGGKPYPKDMDIELNEGEGFIIGDDNVFVVLHS